MAKPPTNVSPRKTVRMLHASLVVGVTAFGLLVWFLLRRQAAGQTPPPPLFITLVPVLSAASCGWAFFLRRYMPTRAPDQSADLFWQGKATTMALVMWAPMEGAALLGFIGYWLGGSIPALAIGVAAVVLMVAFNPGMLERV